VRDYILLRLAMRQAYRLNGTAY